MTTDSFFEGGDKVAGFKFETPGTRHGGKVLEVGEPQQAREVVYDPQTRSYEMGDPKVWKNSGDPIMQRRVVVQSVPDGPDDDGRRAFYFEQGKELTKALVAAVERARGRGRSSPEVGSELEVTFTGTDPDSFKASKKLYRVEYTAPAVGANEPPFDAWGSVPPTSPASQPPVTAGPPVNTRINPELVKWLADRNVTVTADMTPEQADMIAKALPQ